MKKKKKNRNTRKNRKKSLLPLQSSAEAPQKRPYLSAKGLRAHADLASRDSRFKIMYLVPHLTQDFQEASPFGWYTPGLHEAAGPLITAASLPRDIRELYSAPNYSLLQRLTRRIWSSVTPISMEAIVSIETLKTTVGIMLTPFRVIMTNNAAVADEVDQLISKSDGHYLHVSSVEGKGRVLAQKFNLSVLSAYCKQVVVELLADPGWSGFASVAQTLIGNERIRTARNHPLQKGLHNLTTPNESALKAFGWSLNKTDRISNARLIPKIPNSQRYVDRVCRSADAVTEAREQLMRELPALPNSMVDYRYIIAVQSIYWGHFNDWRNRIAQYSGKDKHVFKFAYGLAVQATSYVDEIKFDGNNDILNNEMFIGFQRARIADALSFTAGLTLLASSSLVPVLRLEPKLNQIRGDLKQLADCTRAHAHHAHQRSHWKISRMTSRLSEKMRLLVNSSFLMRIDKEEQGKVIEGLKLVSDLPLELMRSRDLPLSMRFDTSRLPVLPGNLFLSNCVMPPVILSLTAFSEVLVVRSFQANDPLRNVLEMSISKALEQRLNHALTVKVNFVDVFSEDDLVSALNEFKGALMIFDGHGDYDDTIGAGVIVIGNKKVNAWELRSRCSFPSIVIFSACDTQPIDGGHSSIATGAFTLGAHTVLGTSLPIWGVTAGMFIGRLLIRISEFLPLAAKHRTICTWREVISGMLRMSHVTEMIAALKKYAGPIYKDIEFDAIQLKANMAINERNPDWYERFLVDMSALTGQSIEMLKYDIDRYASMTDSMKYIQLGNPENIVIVEKHAEDIFQQEVNALESELDSTKAVMTTEII